jgi:hypothetical protein
MKPEQPALGIMRTNDWGDTKVYRIACDCGSNEHTHDLWVEADESNVTVTVFTKLKSKWWQLNRWQQIWILLTKGYVEYEASLILSQQQALNYAKTLEHAIIDVDTFRNKRKQNNA